MRVIAAYGSGEFQPWAAEVDRVCLEQASAGDGSVVILPTASAPEGDDVFSTWAQMGRAHYEGMGVAARISPLKTRADAQREDVIADLDGASMYYFSGGNPAYLADTLRDTPLWDAILTGLASGVALAGCSAGACIMGDMAPDSAADGEFFAGRWPSDWYRSGLSLLPGVTFSPHWDALDGWIPGITDFIRSEMPEEMTMIALDEDTAMVGDVDGFTVYGAGTVQLAPGGTTSATYRAGDRFKLS